MSHCRGAFFAGARGYEVPFSVAAAAFAVSQNSTPAVLVPAAVGPSDARALHKLGYGSP